MGILTLELPEDLLALLQKRAARQGEEPQEVVVEILQKELVAEEEPETERERVIQALRESGPGTPDEREQMRRRPEQKTFTPPLSEIIIQDRGEL